MQTDDAANMSNMQFGDIGILVDTPGFENFQEVSNAVKKNDFNIPGKLVREAQSFVWNVANLLEVQMEALPENSEDEQHHIMAIDKCTTYQGQWENFLNEKDAHLESLVQKAPQHVPDQAAPAASDDIREASDDIREATPMHQQPTLHNANAVASAQAIISNANVTLLATSALTTFMGAVSQSNVITDKLIENQILSKSQLFPNDKSKRRCIFFKKGADRIQCTIEWTVLEAQLQLERLPSHRVKQQDWKCADCWAKVIVARTEMNNGKGGKGNGGKGTRRPRPY